MHDGPRESVLPDGPPKQRKDARRNRALLLEAGRELFAERGLDVSMDVIAHRAGVGVGTAYRHFANKYELANAIFDDVVSGIVASAEPVTHTTDLWAAFCDSLEQILRAQDDNRAVREMVLATNQDEWAHHDTLLAPVRESFERAQQAGAVRPDITYTDVVLMLVMLCSLTDQAGDVIPQIWRRYLPLLLNGVRSPHIPLPGAGLPDEQLRDALANGLLRYRAD